MLISNFNLYKSEWLDLVFDKRNKEYGAYNIRQHYEQNLTRALLISVVTAVGVALAVGAAIKVEPVITPPTERIIEVTTVKPIEPEKPVEAKPETPPPAKQAEPVKTIKYVEMVAGPDEAAVEPPTKAELEISAVGPETIDAPGTGLNTPVNPSPGVEGGKGTEPVDNNAVVSTVGLSVLPAPVGGNEAWIKFLKNNLHYPDQAIDAGKSGKVWVTFIVEKDGKLTDIKISRGQGYGMDDEALRVLRKAPAWTPGVQDGKNVRVQFTLPLNFSLE